jgi:cation:H+ antiporter
MTAWLDGLKLTGGLVYLLLGGDLLVRGAIGFSSRTRIPEAVVGLTIVALGTSAPELFVSVYAALAGHGEIALGNVIGSNVANALLVLGVPAVVHSIATHEVPGLWRDASYMLSVTFLFIGLCFLSPFTTADGVGMLALLVLGLIVMYRAHGASFLDDREEDDDELGLPERVWVILLFLALGIVMLPIGADLTVESAEAIALRLGVSEGVIAASLIALGTSLPELSTTVIAAMRGRSSIALGNVIGSNVLNILAIMGITSIAATVHVPDEFLLLDVWVMLAATIVLWWIVVRRRTIGRATAAALLGAYATYIALLYGG